MSRLSEKQAVSWVMSHTLDPLDAAHGSIHAMKIHEAIPSLVETPRTDVLKVSSFSTTLEHGQGLRGLQ
jgi:hypothetical protein